jgi:hypothetical protein
LPPQGALPADADSYAGWYEPNSPRVQMFFFLERILNLVHVSFTDGKMVLRPLLAQKPDTFLPVEGRQFRKAPEKDPPFPVASAMLLTPDAQGKYIQVASGTATWKRVPTWLAIAEIGLTAFVALAVVSVLLYAPFWLLGGLSKKRRRPQERAMRWWPLLAALSLAGVVVLIGVSAADVITRMGNLTVWSCSVFVLTILFAIASLASAWAAWRANDVRKWVGRYSAAVAVALVIATAYFLWWGVIGLRTWG